MLLSNGMDLPQSFLDAMKMESLYLQTNQGLLKKEESKEQLVEMTLNNSSSTVVVEQTEIIQTA